MAIKRKRDQLTMIALSRRERKLLEKLADLDAGSLSSVVRRLILEEGRRRKLLLDETFAPPLTAA